MTLQRRLSIFTFALLLLLTTVGAVGVAIIVYIQPALASRKTIFFGDYGFDDAVMILCSLTCTAVVITVVLALLTRRGIMRRLRQFQLPPGADASVLISNAGDELDYAAQRLNELSEAVAQMRANQRSEDEVLAAKRFADNIVQSMSDILIVTDPALRIVTVNQAACRLLEYSEIELVGRPIEDVFKQESITLAPP